MLNGGLGLAPSERLRNVCGTEWNKLKNAGYLFLRLQRGQVPSGGTSQANYLRTQPVSSNEGFSPLQLCSQECGKGGRAQSQAGGGAALRPHVQLSSRKGMGGKYPQPRQGA